MQSIKPRPRPRDALFAGCTRLEWEKKAMISSWLISFSAGPVARGALAGSCFVYDDLFARHFLGTRMAKGAAHTPVSALELIARLPVMIKSGRHPFLD